MEIQVFSSYYGIPPKKAGHENVDLTLAKVKIFEHMVFSLDFSY